MPRKLSKRRLRVQLTFVYTIMVIAVVAIVGVLVLVVQGYRFNRYDGKLEQGGLVQFDSNPDGANVSVDSTLLANKTASKIVLTAGDHHIQMTRDGYNTWEKDVTVKPGSVLWLDYALLFPTDPTVKSVASYKAVASALPSPNTHTMAVITDATQPDITLTALNTNSPTNATITIPQDAYTQPADGMEQSFSLVQWDKNSNLLLVKHKVDKTTEYLSVDTRDTSRTVNISAKLGVTASAVAYALNDSSKVYLLSSSHELRRASLSSLTLSGPLASDVSDFSVTESNVVVYETLADANDQRIVGYVTSDSNKAKVLSSYTGLDGGSLLATTGTYYGDHYVAILHGTTLDILQGNLPSSDSNAVLALQHVAAVTAGDGAKYIGFSPDDDRMIYITKGTHITTYDLELNDTATLTLQKPLTHDVQWLDGYHIAATGTNSYYYDFDGTNGQLFAKDGTEQPAMLSASGKYLYYFTTTDTGSALNRIALTN